MTLTVGSTNLFATTDSVLNNPRTPDKKPLNSVVAEGLKVEDTKAEAQDKLPERQAKLIEKYKDTYDIKKGKVYSYSLKKEVEVYFITAKKDVNLSELCDNLKIDMDIVAQNNGYKKYSGPNGEYIGNKPMKDKQIHVPVGEFGANTTYWDDFVEWVKKLF